MRAIASAIVAGVCLTGAGRLQAEEDQLILGNLIHMTQFPSTWNAGAPKIVSDGLHYYAVICGYAGSASTCSIARRRGLEEWQAFGHWTFTSNQPATMIIDRKGRLNVFWNDPYIHHFRFDHPSVNLVDWVSVPIPFADGTGYLHASYDAGADIIMLTFNETSAFGLTFAVKFTDANGWMVSSLPAASPGTMLLYARAVRGQNTYYVVAGEHVIAGTNASYTAAILFESTAFDGPWTRRVLHQVYGNNQGVAYENWVLANDVQVDAAGRVRALLHITESGSGHADPLDGLYVLRQEDGYLPRLIEPASRGIEDGFVLYVDPAGVHMAFARVQVPKYYPGESVPYTYTGDIVTFRSGDSGATWVREYSQVESALNPTLVETRNGSMLGGSFVPIMYTDEVTSSGPWDEVWFVGVLLGISNTASRYEHGFVDTDGASFYVRAYEDVAAGRYYYYLYDYAPDGSFRITYSYRAGSYCHGYVGDSMGGYRYFNSDGFQVSVGSPTTVRYEVNDGTHTIHLRGMCGDPSRVNRVRIQKPGP